MLSCLVLSNGRVKGPERNNSNECSWPVNLAVDVFVMPAVDAGDLQRVDLFV